MKTFKFIPLFLFVLLSCSSDDTRVAELPDAEPIVLKTQFDNKLKNNNVFAFDLFKATYKNEDKANIFISPLSVDMALGMTWNGAAGDTKTEMQAALRNQGYTAGDINEYAKSLREALINADPSTKLTIANSIWYRSGFDVEQSFIDVNKANYNAEVKGLDFSSPNAVKEINNWCAKNTNNKIPEIIETISSDAVMYLVNAIYFKGIWKYQFEKKNTRDLPFTKENGTTQNIKMMNQVGNLAYSADENARYLEMPYGNKTFSMVIILPQPEKDMENVIRNINNDSWNDAIKNMQIRSTNLQLPQFKLKCDYDMEKAILPDMGMKLAFNSRLADFTGINKGGGLSISKVKHKTFVEVNEEGTEAAAVTSVEMIYTSAEKPQSMDFLVNQPFLFAIKENSTGVILFIGKIGEIPQ
ncbi:MAG: serpin family protein [Prevotella sp.]|jgi:serpin B|nr:serpin family protein [Prevotella sp.]